MYSKGSHNTSAQILNARNGNSVSDPLDENQIYNRERKKAKRENLAHLYKNDYKPAKYQVACQYRDALSYKKKLSDGSYKQLDRFQDTNELKVFGLGPYFFVEYQRRVTWFFFIAAIVSGFLIYLNSISNGLSQYSSSFSTYLINTTIGNFNGDVLTGIDVYLVTAIPCGIYLAFFIFFLIWTAHYNGCISDQDQSAEFIKPEKFCVEVQGFQDLQNVKEEDLQYFFSSFGPIYEVSLVREYKNKLSFFEDLDTLEEEIKEEELQIILGSGDPQNLRSLKKEKEELNKYINTLRIKPDVISAYVHYQFEKSKADMLTYFNNHYLFQTSLHSCVRSICCCAVDDPQQKYLFKGSKLFVKNAQVPEPEDINWENNQIGACSKLCRFLFAFLVIIVFLALSCTIIGLCSIYITSNSVDCEGVVVPDTVAEAQAANYGDDSIDKKCFCNSLLIQSFNSVNIQNYCGNLLNEIYTEQGIQYAIIGTSGFVNFLFGFIVDKVVNLTRPASHSAGYMYKTAFYTIFMIFNTVFLPLMIYANIFGFKTAQYVSFVTIISTDIAKFFNVSNLSLNEDFNRIWYRNVSPVFTNYIIIDAIFTWGFFIFYKCISNKEGLKSDEGSILQKSMNEKITSWKLNAYVEYSYFNLIVFMSLFYCCGIPVLLPLAFANLFSKYVTNRSLVQNNSSKIEGLSEKFNSFPLSLLPFLLIFASCFGSWMLTAIDSIYPNALQITIDFGFNCESTNTICNIFNRQMYLPFFIFLAALVLFYFLFYNLVVRFCSFLASLCYEKKKVTHPYHTLEYSHYAKSMSVLTSYNIRNNPKYKNVIINLERYLEKDEKY